MGGPIHCIALDGTGVKIALSYGSDIVMLEQYAVCELGFTPARHERLSLPGSRLDEREKPPQPTVTTRVG